MTLTVKDGARGVVGGAKTMTLRCRVRATWLKNYASASADGATELSMVSGVGERELRGDGCDASESVARTRFKRVSTAFEPGGGERFARDRAAERASRRTGACGARGAATTQCGHGGGD